LISFPNHVDYFWNPTAVCLLRTGYHLIVVERQGRDLPALLCQKMRDALPPIPHTSYCRTVCIKNINKLFSILQFPAHIIEAECPSENQEKSRVRSQTHDTAHTADFNRSTCTPTQAFLDQLCCVNFKKFDFRLFCVASWKLNKKLYFTEHA
jgi:hypothetical protein